MRKLMWCCTAAAVLAAGGFLSLAYYACHAPESLVGRTMQIIAESSVAMQPLNGLTSLAVRTSQAKSEAIPGSIEAAVPAEPQPIAAEPALEAEEAKAPAEPVNDNEWEAAPIIIREDDPPSFEGKSPVASSSFIEMPNGRPEMPPRMPYADESEHESAEAEAKKIDGSSEEAENPVFKEWMKLFTEGKQDEPSTVEELPPPTEEDEPQSEGKCQEDSHLHEQYPGCPRTTCPYGDKNMTEQYYKRPWDLDPNFDDFKPKKKGKEESSEEPPQSGNNQISGKIIVINRDKHFLPNTSPPTGKKPHSPKESKGEDKPLRTQGVDTMEYRPSDGGLHEYGPGPVH